jgi:CheY-like chemotaxis protein
MPDIASERLPDMVLIDIGLPRMDDYEVARRLGTRNADRTRSSSPFPAIAMNRPAGRVGQRDSAIT